VTMLGARPSASMRWNTSSASASSLDFTQAFSTALRQQEVHRCVCVWGGGGWQQSGSHNTQALKSSQGLLPCCCATAAWCPCYLSAAPPPNSKVCQVSMLPRGLASLLYTRLPDPHSFCFLPPTPLPPPTCRCGC
jgi:hypothetical protein